MLEPAFGGNCSASLDAVVAKLTRAKAGKGYHSAREALLLNGRFVLAQVRVSLCAGCAVEGGGAVLWLAETAAENLCAGLKLWQLLGCLSKR